MKTITPKYSLFLGDDFNEDTYKKRSSEDKNPALKDLNTEALS
jgi:hypothetical protein